MTVGTKEVTVEGKEYRIKILGAEKGTILFVKLFKKLLGPTIGVLAPILQPVLAIKSQESTAKPDETQEEKEAREEADKSAFSASIMEAFSTMDFSFADNAVSKLSESLDPKEWNDICKTLLFGSHCKGQAINASTYDICFGGDIEHLHMVVFQALTVNFPKVKSLWESLKGKVSSQDS